MNEKYPGAPSWSTLGLAALMLVGCLVGAVGIATARYRADEQANAVFQPQAPVQVYLGQLRPDETSQTYTFDTAQQSWQSVEEEDNRYYQLSFAISNSPTMTEFPADTQQVRIRLVGSVGLWNMDEEVPVVLKLRVPKPVKEPEDTAGSADSEDGDAADSKTPEEPETPDTPETPDQAEADPTEPELLYDEYTAVVSRVAAGTALYHTYGDGWLFRFLDEEGRELTWDLAGGQFSCMTVDLILEGSDPATTTLLQLQIIGDKKAPQ